jgi:ubiquinone biosynthesis protein UbiJ
MSLALLQTTLLLPLEAMLNGMLALDAASRSRLAALEGRTLSVYVTQPALALHLSIRNGRLCLSPLFEGSASATLRGPAGGLLRLLLQGETPASLAPFGVELQGSTAFMQDLQRLLRDVDIDWEFHLSRLIGDLPVAALATGLDTGMGAIGNTVAAVRDNVADYFTYEAGLLPERSAVASFRSGVLDLQLQLDRLQARIDQLSATR